MRSVTIVSADDTLADAREHGAFVVGPEAEEFLAGYTGRIRRGVLT